ncbi:MYXO-CTERM sorting domain-containing protein [Luteolibacter marinus]|uniref:MYXO-CTERM sorting domain-containing protein n=1 Tax=Luteolibacter marinus TaxID=2776705 RepID=UPI001867C301|nr:MYXO-CTERM sorting domain-containing protein [Luteolibacter marinus]
MKRTLWKVAPRLLVLVAVTPTLHGQSITPGDRLLENAFYATDIPFLHGPGPTLQPQLAGFNLQTVNGFGSTYVYDFCADFFTGNNDDASFLVSPGLGGLGSSRQAEMRALFSHALPAFNALLDDYIVLNGGDWAYNAIYASEYDELQGYAAGMQIALWELIHEQTADLSIDDNGSTDGSFRIDVDAVPDTRAALGAAYAEQFLANIGTSTWTDQGRVVYYFANAPDGEQDRLWMTIPEPSAALLGVLGFAALFRRRRF